MGKKNKSEEPKMDEEPQIPKETEVGAQVTKQSAGKDAEEKTKNPDKLVYSAQMVREILAQHNINHEVEIANLHRRHEYAHDDQRERMIIERGDKLRKRLESLKQNKTMITMAYDNCVGELSRKQNQVNRARAVLTENAAKIEEVEHILENLQ